MTDAPPLASEQITQDADLLTRAKVRIAIGKQTGAHTANRLNIYQIAEELLAALSATPAPNGVVPLDEPNCTNDDYLRRKALTEMVAMDEQMEAEHPGWMTGEFTPAPSDQDASQAQGEVERFTQPYTERRGDDIFVTFDAPHDEVQPFILDVEHAAALRDQLSAALSPAPGATAQDGEAWRNDPASLESGLPCPSSLDGRHQVDTSMESGPNNCFHCEAPMGGKA